jgi:hypothetical protein
MKIYRGIFKDVEALPGAANILNSKTHRIDIIDANNPYNIVLTSETVGVDVQYTFTFDPLPAGAFQTQILWSNDGGLTWNASVGGASSPQQITLPASVYLFQFAIYFPDNVVYYWENSDQIIPIDLSEEPLRDIIIDNDEDKFTPVRSRQLEIRLHSSSNININTFASSDDRRFTVKHYINDVLQFTGFLSTADLQQDFQPDPNVITLVAMDGLGFLADIRLREFGGDIPEGGNKLLDYLLWCLYATGLRLNVNIVFNIREVTAPSLNSDNDGTGHFFNQIGVDALTWEDGVGERLTCMDVLERILKPGMTISQYLGEWWIIRLDEQDFNLTHTFYKWDWQGNFLIKGTALHEDTIGSGDDHEFINDDAVVSLSQAFRKLELKYALQNPEEVPCNIDFERGDVIDDSIPASITYELDCWTKWRENYPTSGLIPADTNIYTRRRFENGYEKERFVVIENVDDPSNLIMSSDIIVQAKDKIRVGMTRSLNADVGGSGFYRDHGMQVRLYGDYGTFWTLQGETSVGDQLEWVQSDADFTTFNNYLWFEGDVSRDMTEIESLYGNTLSPPLPVGGILRILALQSQRDDWNRDTYIHSVEFELQQYINGSYQKYTAQQHIVEQGVNNQSVKEEDVYISDSPHPMFKGALKIYNNSLERWVLAGLFYNAATEPNGVVNAKRYGEIQAFDVWNQVNRIFSTFEGEIDHATPVPAVINRYVLSDANENTAHRYFILLWYELDHHSCAWTGVLTEVASSVINKQYTGNSFKYVTK